MGAPLGPKRRTRTLYSWLAARTGQGAESKAFEGEHLDLDLSFAGHCPASRRFRPVSQHGTRRYAGRAVGGFGHAERRGEAEQKWGMIFVRNK